MLRGAGVIQGDGIDIEVLKKITLAVENAGFSSQNVAYGMGGGLLQKINRDTMSFATKLSKIVYDNGIERDVMKMPKEDKKKHSLPGEFLVCRESNNAPIVYPIEFEQLYSFNELVTVYDNGKVCDWDSFDAVRSRLNSQWDKCPKLHDPLSQDLIDKIARVGKAQKLFLQECKEYHEFK